MRSRRPALLTAGLVLAALPLLASTAFAAPGNARAEAAREREATLRYWTADRMRAAIPRDFVFDPVRGFQPAAKGGKPGGGGGGGGGGGTGGTTSTSGAFWPDGKGEIYGAVGKVFFTLSGTNYVCSGTVTEDGRADRVIVLTAGHCAYDETVQNSDSGFASRWMFVPEYDATPSVNCFSTPSSCWTADELVVHSGWATAGGFTATATTYDWAFAVIGAGSGPSSGQLGGTVDAFPFSATSYPSGTFMYAYGYPAAAPFDGRNLRYCAGSIGFDRWNGNRTYKMTCDMTGGSSGGGWLSGANDTGDTGTLASVNSYRYGSGNAMYGPKFNSATGSTWSAAQNVAFDTDSRGFIVP